MIKYMYTKVGRLFNKLVEEKTVPYLKLNKYDASIWGQDKTLEPLREMKEFKGAD